MKWASMPHPTEEEIEEEAVFLVKWIMERKKRIDRPGAKWKVGTTQFEVARPENPNAAYIAVSGRHLGSAHMAAQEIAAYHGMEIEGCINKNNNTIFAYTDRFPTIDERKRREKEPLTLKQKIAFRAIKGFVDTNGVGPTKTQAMKILGHRSAKSTKGYLDILERKNWIFVSDGRRRIELL